MTSVADFVSDLLGLPIITLAMADKEIGHGDRRNRDTMAMLVRDARAAWGCP